MNLPKARENIVLVLLMLLLPRAHSQPSTPRLRPLPPASQNSKSGPEPGQRIPDFQLPDQHGVSRDFASLTGKNGLLLAFVRSADW